VGEPAHASLRTGQRKDDADAAVEIPAGRGGLPALWRWPQLLGALLAVIVAGIALGWLLVRRHPLPTVELAQRRLTFNSSENGVQIGAISPDGRYLAYSDLAGIHVKLLSTGDERLIAKPASIPAGAMWLAQSWFPDSTQLLANTYEAGGHESMWTVSVLGQSARELREGSSGREVSPDGARIAFTPEREASGYVREIWLMSSQGYNPQRVLAVGVNEWLDSVHWSPDGQRLAYTRVQGTGDRYQASIETCDLKGANRTTVISYADLLVKDYRWLPEGRIVYSRQESPGSNPDNLGSNDDNLWQVSVNGATGAPTAVPKRISQWAGSSIEQLSASADGKRLTFLKATYQMQIYVGELTAGGRHMGPARRLTNDEAFDAVGSWSPDSKAIFFFSNRNGPWGIFKQEINQETAEPVVTGPQDAVLPRLSPDGAWILYAESPRTASTPVWLMRIPVSGGVSQPVFKMGNWLSFECARAPASVCVVLEASQDEKQLVITAFEPLNGRGKVLRTIEKEQTASLNGNLSPDGSMLAVSRYGEAEIHMRLLSLSGGSDGEFTVKGWPNMTGIDWSPDQKGIYLGSVSPQVKTVLYVDLQGNARVLWQYKGAGGITCGMVSPDGHHLATLGSVQNSNVWMLEGF
jgi:Tol biopolymer transport system component